MSRPATILTWLGLVATAPALVAHAQTSSSDAARGVTIARAGSQPSAKGSAQSFTGSVRVDPLFAAVEPSRVSGGHVTFEPGARSAWHTHPVGQILIVTSGLGWVQEWGGKARDQAGRRRADRAGRETLARRFGHHGHDPHCHPGGCRGQECRLDGTGQRRTVSSSLT